MITEDRWLAGVFGRPVFRLDVGRDEGRRAGALAELISSHTAGRAAAFYYAKVDTRDTRTVRELGGAGLAVVDVNVTLDRASAPAPMVGGAVDVHDARAGEHAAVLDIAGCAFQFSRFHLDPLVPRPLADRVKREWIANYLRGGRGERLLVATVDGRPVGFLAVLAADVDGKVARIIDLVAVAPEAQRLGAGTALVSAFVRVASDSSDRLRVGTQVANAPSLRLYTRLGFQIVHSAYVMHLHIGSGLEEAA